MVKVRDDCPFCHHERASLYIKDQALRMGGFRDIYLCSECGLLYPRPRMDASESLAYLTNHYLSSGKARLNDPTKAIKGCALRRWRTSRGNLLNMGFFARKQVSPKEEVLDIGTFSGQFCYILQSLGLVAYGLELFDEAARFAREKGLKVSTGTFPDNLPSKFSQMKFSLISMMECVCYMVDLKKSLKKVHEMLKSEGYFLIKCHQGKSRYYHNGRNSLFKRYGDHAQGIPTLESMKYCLKDVGFEIVRVLGAASEMTAPVNFGRFIHKNNRFRALFTITESILNKICESFMLDIKEADQLIILAKKMKTSCPTAEALMP